MSAPAPLDGHGFSVRLPASWEGRIYRRPTPGSAFAPDSRITGSAADAGRAGLSAEQTRAVVHLADFALPADRGDYGSGAVERMASRNTFVAILEFAPECLGTALYRAQGIPRTEARLFNPNGLQRRIAGQAGCQFFFTENDRPMCLYVVIGSHRDAAALSAKVNQVLDGITVDAT